jgi:hypothetical protein
VQERATQAEAMAEEYRLRAIEVETYALEAQRLQEDNKTLSDRVMQVGGCLVVYLGAGGGGAGAVLFGFCCPCLLHPHTCQPAKPPTPAALLAPAKPTTQATPDTPAPAPPPSPG